MGFYKDNYVPVFATKVPKKLELFFIYGRVCSVYSLLKNLRKNICWLHFRFDQPDALTQLFWKGLYLALSAFGSGACGISNHKNGGDGKREVF